MPPLDRINSLKKNGTSFYIASQIFDHNTLKKVSLLYAFCRYVDDCADKESVTGAQPKMQELLDKLINNTHSDSSICLLVDELIVFGIAKENLLCLIRGAIFDVEGGLIRDDNDLLQYCYLVAGSVGMMMCDLFHVQSKKARQHAVALGIAMQLTNICRDVLEDALNGRVYLPSNSLAKIGLTAEKLRVKGPAPQPLKNLIQNYLELSHQYYQWAFYGLAFLPLRIRLAVLAASELYQGIGVKIYHHRYEVLEGRTVLNSFERSMILVKSGRALFKPSFWTQRTKQSSLALTLTRLINDNYTLRNL